MLREVFSSLSFHGKFYPNIFFLNSPITLVTRKSWEVGTNPECGAFSFWIRSASGNLHMLSLEGRRWIINLISSVLFLKCIWKQMTDLHNQTITHTWILHYFLKRGMYWFITVVAYKHVQLFLSCFLARCGFCWYINEGENFLYEGEFIIHCWWILLIK